MTKTEIYPYRGMDDHKLPRFFVHHQETPGPEAKFAMAILERWAMVQGKDDGEDTAGRAKIGLMEVDDTVDRACDLAHRAFEVFRQRQWLLDVPSLDEMEEQIKAREDARENDGKPRR